MELHNGRLFWGTTQDREFPVARKEKSGYYDVIIVGGGMSGALCAYTLSAAGMRIAVLDKGVMGAGSTLANTGLIQFSNDIMLHKLMEQIGEERAVRFYKLCVQAVDHLEEAAYRLEQSSDFIRRSSLYYASGEADAPLLRKEYETLVRHGFQAEYWTRNSLMDKLPFVKPAALVTRGDAELNPYRFIRGLVRLLNRRGVHLFEQAEVTGLQDRATHLELQTSIGKLRGAHVVFTTGYSNPPGLREAGVELNRSYAIATRPVEGLSKAWKDRMLIWETRRPYFYMRTTTDDRIIAGGLDEDKPDAPHDPRLIEDRAQRLKEEVESLFPMLTITVDFAWGAVFGESRDNLPFIGRHPARDRVYYLLGYGGNGTVYSMLGSEVLRDLILGRPNRDAEMLRLDRMAPDSFGSYRLFSSGH
ncbi:MAG: oxidoreductase [Paenibacillaceae bacterium]|jgi:glycine/D-amino acid oxidase-like deaminating enzyme|nr:oxidoreductase [Paenibacillaceae bacterium]